jgi:hypothetical protein
MGNAGRKVGTKSWNEGLTKETDKRLQKLSEKRRGCVFGDMWLYNLSVAHGGVGKPKETKRFANQRRRALKAGAEGSHTFGEWETLKKQCGNKCLMCGEIEPNIKLTEDHIVPLSKGGTDYIENIQPLCLACNTRKHTKVINFLGGGELF